MMIELTKLEPLKLFRHVRPPEVHYLIEHQIEHNCDGSATDIIHAEEEVWVHRVTRETIIEVEKEQNKGEYLRFVKEPGGKIRKSDTERGTVVE